jgi:hypothetical protein
MCVTTSYSTPGGTRTANSPREFVYVSQRNFFAPLRRMRTCTPAKERLFSSNTVPIIRKLGIGLLFPEGLAAAEAVCPLGVGDEGVAAGAGACCAQANSQMERSPAKKTGVNVFILLHLLRKLSIFLQ